MRLLDVEGIVGGYASAEHIVKDVALSADTDEVVTIIGPNGAGKSTALKVITGLVTPERGVVRLNGRTITFTSPEQRARLGIEMLPGGAGVFRSLSVRDNLLVGAYRYRHDRSDVERRVDALIDAEAGRFDAALAPHRASDHAARLRQLADRLRRGVAT